MIIIPAIDLKDRKCVRLFQGNINKIKFYSDNPVDIAKKFQDDGAQLLHIIDIDATQSGELKNFNIIKEIINNVNIKIQVGGGIRTIERIEQYLNIGITRVIISTLIYEIFMSKISITKLQLTDTQQLINFLTSAFDSVINLFKKYKDKIIVALDSQDGFISIYGWQKKTRMKTLQFAQSMSKLGCRRFIITDTKLDGTLTQPNFKLIEKLTKVVDKPIIASGGISSLEDIKKLKELNLEGVIIGKALYEGKIKLREAIEIAMQK